MVANPDGRAVEQGGKEAPGGESFRGFSVRCSCGALAFDWITTESGRFVLRCAFCDETVLEGENVELGDEQRSRLERLEDRRVRV
jgi:hypothetical protein